MAVINRTFTNHEDTSGGDRATTTVSGLSTNDHFLLCSMPAKSSQVFWSFFTSVGRCWGWGVSQSADSWTENHFWSEHHEHFEHCCNQNLEARATENKKGPPSKAWTPKHIQIRWTPGSGVARITKVWGFRIGEGRDLKKSPKTQLNQLFPSPSYAPDTKDSREFWCTFNCESFQWLSIRVTDGGNLRRFLRFFRVVGKIWNCRWTRDWIVRP